VGAGHYSYFADPPIGMAHRGGSSYPPNVGFENTVRAFQTAVDLGYRYLETDIQATADGQVVAFHDDRLDRVTDRTGLIASMPWRQVREARVGGTEPIPTLPELLEAFPDARFNLDLKGPGTASPVWEAIRRHAAYDRVCIGSFSPRRLGQFRKLAGTRVATAAGQLGIAALRFLPQRISSLAHSPAQVLQVPVGHVVAGRPVTVVTPQIVEAVHRVGMHVHVWTIDDRAQMERLLDMGVDGIHSGRIDVLKDVLVARGHWPA
jgi:glycerophosphoryl diester phosphodiesterase